MDDAEQSTLASASLNGYTNDPLEDFERIGNAAWKSTVIALSHSLREGHPDLVLTVALDSDCDLLAFAKVGFAHSELDPNTGLSGHSIGTFEKHAYRWRDHEFLLYLAECYQEPDYCTQLYSFILAKPEGKETTKSDSATTDALVQIASQWTLDLHHEVWMFDQLQWQKNKQLWRSVQDALWDDVILDKATKESIRENIEGFFDERDTFQKYGLPWKRGILFHGPPGNGKTISIKAMMRSLAERANPVASLYVKSFSGTARPNPEYAIRQVFKKARETAPCLLIFEDVDSLVTNATRSYFLNQIDGLEKNDGVLMIGTTNHLDRLDPGISKRPSRFDRKYLFDMPTKGERIQYNEFWRAKLSRNPKIEFPQHLCTAIAEIMENFTFAYMKEAFVAALLQLAAEQKSAYLENPEGGNKDDLEGIPLWIGIRKQVNSLKKELDAGSDETLSETGSDGTLSEQGETQGIKNRSCFRGLFGWFDKLNNS